MEISGQSSSKHHLISLDGYRGIAAIFVAGLHSFEAFNKSFFASNAEMAVDYFFILSGFVVALSYQSKLTNRQISFWSFFKIRLIRLYPMIFLGAVLGIAWRLIEGRFSLTSIAISGLFALVLIPIPRPGEENLNSYPINGPGWSLTYEIVVNLIFAAFAKYLYGRNLYVITILSVLIDVVFAYGKGSMLASTGWHDQIQALFRTLAPFLMGVCLVSISSQFVKTSNLIPLIGALIICLALTFQFNAVTYQVACLLLLFPSVMIAGMSQPSWPWLRALMVWLGEISFPLYAINFPVAYLTFGLLKNFGHENWPFEWLSLGVSILLSVIFSRHFDQPLRSYLTRRFK